jgi:hypothetical protein
VKPSFSLFSGIVSRKIHLAHNAIYIYIYIYIYTGCPRRNVPNFGIIFLKLKYTDLTKNTYIRSGTFTEIMAREKCGLLAVPRTVPGSCNVLPIHCACPSFSLSPLKRMHAVTTHVKCLET